ncbi:MAG TPA: hypothetical protein VFV02_00055 [Acidimicrobiales bacterium]|nr:hypothetical protein [Acidimicrobiales bacterium]
MGVSVKASVIKVGMVAGSLCLLTFAVAACGSSSKTSSSGATSANTKSVFCGDNVKLDKAFANVQSTSDLLSAMKTNQSVINEMAAHLPPGTVGNEAKQVLTAVQQAIAKDDASVLATVNNSYGGDIDTYCGVDTNGDPLPANFAKGKGTSLCNADATLSDGVGNASDSTAVLAFLKSHPTEINTFAAGISGLPSSVQTAAQTLVSTARTAITSNDPSGLDGQSFQDAGSAVDLYCGINQ